MSVLVTAVQVIRGRNNTGKHFDFRPSVNFPMFWTILLQNR